MIEKKIYQRPLLQRLKKDISYLFKKSVNLLKFIQCASKALYLWKVAFSAELRP